MYNLCNKYTAFIIRIEGAIPSDSDRFLHTQVLRVDMKVDPGPLKQETQLQRKGEA